MKRLWAALFVTASVSIAGAQSAGTGNGAQNASPNPSQNPPQTGAQTAGQNGTSRPRRVSAKLDGFDLAPDKASANQTGGASRSAGGSGRVVPYAPHKGRLYTLRPAFSWQGTAGETYKFHIQDVSGQFSWERNVNGTALEYPSDAPPLEPGKTYIWRVRADSPMIGAATPPAMIVVLSDEERSHLEAAGTEGSGEDEETARAKLYFDHRLWYDAVMTYSDLIAKHPGDTKLYLMRGSLYDQLPATQALADRDFAKAE